jgi:glutamine synthetase
MGFGARVGPEAEFYLFKKGEDGFATTVPTDEGTYFDYAASGIGEETRRAMVMALQDMGFQVETSHHESSPGQHEIGLAHADALTTADRIATLRLVVRRIAGLYGLHATFMPKPVQGLSGSGLHLHMSLERHGRNAFLDEHQPMALSQEALCFIGGLMEHAQAYTAVVCSTVNSYKRLVPGYEAPVFVAWSERNRSPLVRVPAFRGPDTRVELRSPDPAGNPYLTLAVTLGAGLDGISRGVLPPRPVDRNLYRMDARERARLGIADLPRDLGRALELAEKSMLVRQVLGDHIMERFLEAKGIEWEIYSTCVHKWEVDHYLNRV